jgi:hypothetical protein
VNVGPARVRIEERPGIKWGGMCSWKKGDTYTTISVHRSVVGGGDFSTLRRIVAHETIHHALDLTVGRHDHGARFLVYAAKINAVEGEGYVTVKCASDYVYGGDAKEPYHLVLKPHPAAAGRWMYAWCGPRPSAKLRAAARSHGARIARVTAHKWADGAPRATGNHRWAVSRAEDAEELRRLFEAAGPL